MSGRVFTFNRNDDGQLSCSVAPKELIENKASICNVQQAGASMEMGQDMSVAVSAPVLQP